MDLEENDALESMENLFSNIFDEPFADPASILNHLIFRRVASHYKVCLTGDGADELFGGYRRHQGHLLAQNSLFKNTLVRRMASVVASTLPDRRDSVFHEKVRLMARFLSSLENASSNGISWLSRSDTTLDNHISSFDVVSHLCEWENKAANNIDHINSLLSAEMQWTIPNQMMVKIDRTSMDVGLEVRSPFLDKTVIENAFSLPGSMKLKRGRGKAILRELFQHDLPPHIFNEKKHGFEMPLGTWLNGPFKKYTEAIMDDEFLEEIGVCNDLVDKWLSNLKLKKSNSAAEYLWTLIGLNVWLKNR